MFESSLDRAAAADIQTPRWMSELNDDPLPWLLDADAPAVRHLTLRWLLDLPAHDPRVVAAQRAAMTAQPIAAILGAQQRGGYWEKSGPGYATKYRGTVWQVIFLDQLGADATDQRIRAACSYVLDHTQASSGGFGASGAIQERPPPTSSVIHCLNGNLLRALLGFGWLDDARVQRAIDWQARAVCGEAPIQYYASGTSGPAFACAANGGKPCAWGAIKALLALARVPPDDRSALVQRAIRQGTEFLMSSDPSTAGYPTAGDTSPSTSWFKVGFPSGYVADVLQNLEVLCELGYASGGRLGSALAWLLRKQDAHGQWKNEYAYNGKTWADFEQQGAPGKWVTLRACHVLKQARTP
jgi:hypothetical protein